MMMFPSCPVSATVPAPKFARIVDGDITITDILDDEELELDVLLDLENDADAPIDVDIIYDSLASFWVNAD